MALADGLFFIQIDAALFIQIDAAFFYWGRVTSCRPFKTVKQGPAGLLYRLKTYDAGQLALESY